MDRTRQKDKKRKDWVHWFSECLITFVLIVGMLMVIATLSYYTSSRTYM